MILELKPILALIIIIIVGVFVMIISTFLNWRFYELTSDWSKPIKVSIKIFGYILLTFYVTLLVYQSYTVYTLFIK